MSLVSEFRHRQPQLHQEAVSLSSDTKQPHSRVSSVQASYQNFNYFSSRDSGPLFSGNFHYLVLTIPNTGEWLRRVWAAPVPAARGARRCPPATAPAPAQWKVSSKPIANTGQNLVKCYNNPGKVIALKWLQVQWISSQSTTITRSSSSIETCR